MNTDIVKLRFTTADLQVREAEEGNESRTITGCAIVFNRETTLHDGKYYRIREVIDPSCVTAEFLREQDIKLNLYHDREKSVARNNKGVGSLQLDLREDGLYFTAEMPKCDLGDQALELVRNKTIIGCSFEFIPEVYTSDTTTLPDGREDEFIRHTKFRSLSALTLALDPAYSQTSVSEREAYDELEKLAGEQNEAKEREAAEAEAKEQARREMDIRNRQIDAIRRQVDMAIFNTNILV